MRTCDNCGAEVVPGDVFCGTCGAFLDWDGDEPAGPTRTAEAGPPKPRPAPAVEAGPEVGPEVGSEAGPEVVPAGTAPTADATARVAGPGDRDGTGAEERKRRAAALVVPVRPADDDGRDSADRDVPGPASGGAPPVPAADQPGAVRPGRPVAPAPVVRDFAGDRADGTDAVTCPACGTGNPAGRAFCRRCGGSLVTAAGPAAAVPWWRRLRRPRLRPGRGRLRRLLAVLAVLVLLAGAAWAVVRFGGPVVDAIRDRTTTPEPVLPTSVTASSEARGHPARSTVDGLNNRYWSPATDRPAEGEYVELTFDPPIRLMDLIVHAGASPQQDEFVRQGRPAELTMTTWTRGGESNTERLRLTDRPGPQTFHHVTGGVARLRLTIGASYGAEPGRQVALAEVEVFRRP
jgi:hypothetical protein